MLAALLYLNKRHAANEARKHEGRDNSDGVGAPVVGVDLCAGRRITLSGVQVPGPYINLSVLFFMAARACNIQGSDI